MDSKRVFILGAGFSKQAGMPLATGLTPLLRRKFEEYDHEEALAWLTSLDERINWLKQTDNNASPSLNIEELFDFAHFDALTWKIRQHMCPVGRNSGDTPYSTGEADDKLASRIKNRILQMSNKQFGIGIAGLGRYKPLDAIPGSGRVWHNAGRALYRTDEIYVIGFSLSPFDTMARLHFAGVMCERAKKRDVPKSVVLIDPCASDREANFRSVFGPDVRIVPIQKPAEEVDWNALLGQ